MEGIDRGMRGTDSLCTHLDVCACALLFNLWGSSVEQTATQAQSHTLSQIYMK